MHDQNSSPDAISTPLDKIAQKKQSVRLQALRFLGWWFGFSGLYAMFAVCPFCGQTGCPVGAGTAGLFGGFFAVVMKGKTFFSALASMFKRKKSSKHTNNNTEQAKEQGDTNV